MKSRKITIALLAITVAGLSLTACKKTAVGENKNTLDSAQTQSNDQVMANKETDESASDATAALENSGGSFASRPARRPAISLPCDATVTYDTAATQKSITITYNGANCSDIRTRTGKIIILFDSGLHWRNSGATINVDYDSLLITRNSDGKTLLINGNVTHTNVSGGLLADLNSNSITRTIVGNLALTFDNTPQRSWQISEQRVFTYDNGIVLTTTGTGADGVVETGINRYGNAFTAAITQPGIIKQSCDFRIVSGTLLYKGPYATVTTTFGLDANGNSVSSCPIGFFYYKQVWSILGRTYTFTGPY